MEIDTGGSALPAYHQLPRVGTSHDAHAWDVWGTDDELGSVNRLTPERVRHAATLVRTGAVISLGLPLDQPTPGLFPDRTPYRHHVEITRIGRDDSVDGLFLQYSSQWDGLQHIRYREYGYWGGRQESDLDKGGALGIQHWARHGIVGRGVLVDVAAHLSAIGEYAPDRRTPIDGALIEAVLASQGVDLREGDILVLRTAWLDWYLGLDAVQRGSLIGTVEPDGLACAGLDPGRLTAAWLWDNAVAAIAADNPALEALPVHRNIGFQHRRLIPLLGMPIGEFWDLRALAAACAGDGRYDFMLVSAPLDIPGGAGSPANAYAIR